MSKTPTPEPADKRRFVNRNTHLSAAAKIVDILSGFDHTKRNAIMRTVHEALVFEQAELPMEPAE